MDLIIYHRDLDGLASALIARKKYPKAELCSIQYGEELQFANKYINHYSTIILVDFSFSQMMFDSIILPMTDNLIWIDHHKTASELPLWHSNIKGYRDITKAACQLTWDYFFPNKDTPYPIQLVADMDMWQFKYYATKPFIERLQLYAIEDIEMFNNIFFGDIEEYIKEGAILVDYKTAQVKKIYKTGHVTKWEGLNCYMCTSSLYISELGNYAVHQPGVDIAKISKIEWQDKWVKVNTLISKDIDVSKIAKRYGGGGHKHASGFTEELI